MIILKHFMDDFLAFVPLQLPQLIDVTTMEEPKIYGDYALLTFPLREPYDLEEVMDILKMIWSLLRCITIHPGWVIKAGTAPVPIQIRHSARCIR